MSSTNKTTNYELSQFVGTDIPSILGDYNGDMRKIDSAIKDASVAGGENAVAIAELQSATTRMNSEIGGINSTVNTLSGKVVDIEEVVPATASAQNKLLTAQELPEIPSITELEEDVTNLNSNVESLERKTDGLPDYNHYYIANATYLTSDTVKSALTKVLRALGEVAGANNVGIKRNLSNLSVQLGGFYGDASHNYFVTLRGGDYNSSTYTLVGIASCASSLDATPKIIVAKILAGSSSFEFSDCIVSDVYAYSLDGTYKQSIGNDPILQENWGNAQLWKVGN